MPVSITTVLTKDPNATLDYVLDLTKWVPTGDTLSAASWTCVPGDEDSIIDVSPAPSISGSKATVWLTGGTAGQVYDLTCAFTTTQGRVDNRTVQVKIREQ